MKKGSGYSFDSDESFTVTGLCGICGVRFSQERQDKPPYQIKSQLAAEEKESYQSTTGTHFDHYISLCSPQCKDKYNKIQTPRSIS